MTFREKLQQEHPALVGPQFVAGCAHCPAYYGYEENCVCFDSDIICTECWDREIEKEE